MFGNTNSLSLNYSMLIKTKQFQWKTIGMKNKSGSQIPLFFKNKDELLICIQHFRDHAVCHWHRSFPFIMSMFCRSWNLEVFATDLECSYKCSYWCLKLMRQFVIEYQHLTNTTNTCTFIYPLPRACLQLVRITIIYIQLIYKSKLIIIQ